MQGKGGEGKDREGMKRGEEGEEDGGEGRDLTPS